MIIYSNTEKRFEMKVNQHNQCDIVDWVESKEKNAICIYNDLGDYHFSSAKALCELLNELHDENKELKAKVDDKEVAVEVETCKIMEKVFALINEKIVFVNACEENSQIQNDDYYRGALEILEVLKKELKK